ncbi:20627_t:CDS:2 [Dentiscutata erythropus]|uniref:20627_t:CDS:1 n=1 Tax=Dentiscutata erythropus TaxID=1348616 RepID=A0A9N8VT58_9GLOM|nr:20627_t:CDS:2 [Dentiscutata erythropus]
MDTYKDFCEKYSCLYNKRHNSKLCVSIIKKICNPILPKLDNPSKEKVYKLVKYVQADLHKIPMRKEMTKDEQAYYYFIRAELSNVCNYPYREPKENENHEYESTSVPFIMNTSNSLTEYPFARIFNMGCVDTIKSNLLYDYMRLKAKVLSECFTDVDKAKDIFDIIEKNFQTISILIVDILEKEILSLFDYYNLSNRISLLDENNYQYGIYRNFPCIYHKRNTLVNLFKEYKLSVEFSLGEKEYHLGIDRKEVSNITTDELIKLVLLTKAGLLNKMMKKITLR